MITVNEKDLEMNIQISGLQSITRFQELVQRACNLWPDAHPEIKEFADKVTEGKVQQDYHRQEYYKLDSYMKPQLTKESTMYSSFPADIRAMNTMYKLADIRSIVQIVKRLPQFNDILDKEFTELTDIQVELDKRLNSDETTALADATTFARVAMADLLGDIIVYCASEAARWGIPLQAVLQVIMLSNQSKLGTDGQPIINKDNGKFEKGPNYWKPEPFIETLLATGRVEVPFNGGVQSIISENQ